MIAEEVMQSEELEAWREDNCPLDDDAWTAGVEEQLSSPRVCTTRQLPQAEGGVVLIATFSREVNRLIAGEDDDGDLIVAIHNHILTGNSQIVYDLVMLVFGITAPEEVDARCLALEILATSPLPNREAMMMPMLKFCLASGIERLQFRAIGAANTLPKVVRLELRGAIEEVGRLSAADSSAHRLATLFLSHNE